MWNTVAAFCTKTTYMAMMPAPNTTPWMRIMCSTFHVTATAPASTKVLRRGRPPRLSTTSASKPSMTMAIIGESTTPPMLSALSRAATTAMESVVPGFGSTTRPTSAMQMPMEPSTAPLKGTFQTCRNEPSVISTLPHSAPRAATTVSSFRLRRTAALPLRCDCRAARRRPRCGRWSSTTTRPALPSTSLTSCVMSRIVEPASLSSRTASMKRPM